MTGTDFCVNKPHMSRSYLNHLVAYINLYWSQFHAQPRGHMLVGNVANKIQESSILKNIIRKTE
jgi:sulfur relay (sulfurtransferase) DsrC/TusE family protein